MTDMEKIEDYIIENQQIKPVRHKHHSINDSDLEDVIEPKLGIWHWFTSFFKSDKRIGELNGHWAFLFKFVLLVLLFIIPTLGTWGVWVTNNVMTTQFHVEQTEQYESRISALEKHNVKAETIAQTLDTQINKLEKVNQEQNAKLESLEKSNSTEHSQILIMLEAMKATLEVIKQRG